MLLTYLVHYTEKHSGEESATVYSAYSEAEAKRIALEDFGGSIFIDYVEIL
jgi:hypothetical protein